MQFHTVFNYNVLLAFRQCPEAENELFEHFAVRILQNMRAIAALDTQLAALYNESAYVYAPKGGVFI